MMYYSRLIRKEEKHAGDASRGSRGVGCGIRRLKLSLQMDPTEIIYSEANAPPLPTSTPSAQMQIIPSPEQGVCVAKHP